MMSTDIDSHVKNTVISVVVTPDRCGKRELAATLLRKGFFVALIQSAEIEEYGQDPKDRGDWNAIRHGNYGILIDTRLPLPRHYDELAEHARRICEGFAGIEEWHDT
jgi:hypothetical protein